MPTSNIFDPSDLANGTSALTVRDDALATSTDLVQAGVVFNDSTRLLDGGLWSHPQDANNQPAYLGMYQSDIHAVLNDVEAMLANPAATTLGGAAYTLSATDTQTLTQIESQLQTLLTDAPHAIGNSQTAVAAQNEIHATQLSILNEVQSDTGLATALGNVSYLAGTGATNTAFQARTVRRIWRRRRRRATRSPISALSTTRPPISPSADSMRPTCRSFRPTFRRWRRAFRTY